MFLGLLKGFTMSGSLIVAIGAQNAFVIKQGLLQRHLFLTAFLCALIDSLLIILGVLGFGTVVLEYPLLFDVAKYFSVIFLVVYGALSLKSAFKTRAIENREEKALISWKKTVLLLLTITLLNPHVYLDTVVLLGSIASQQPDHEQLYFALGAIIASFLWFFSITYGSRFFAPIFQNPIAWKIIDGVVAVTMWVIAISLLCLC